MSILGSTPHLTKANTRDDAADRTHEGQASWAEQFAHQCIGCDFARKSRPKGNVTCAKFALLTNRRGIPFPGTAIACRYFTPKLDTKSAAVKPQKPRTLEMFD